MKPASSRPTHENSGVKSYARAPHQAAANCQASPCHWCRSRRADLLHGVGDGVGRLDAGAAAGWCGTACGRRRAKAADRRSRNVPPCRRRRRGGRWNCRRSPPATGASSSTGNQVDNSGDGIDSAGDVNGDGLDDLIVSAVTKTVGTDDAAGASYVVFGTTGTQPIDLSAISRGQGGFVINGSTAHTYSGSSVSGGADVNGDGLADLIVGAPGGVYTLDTPGQAFVVFGKSTTSPVELSAVAAGHGGFVIRGQSGGDRCGHEVVMAGDINGDGLADMIVRPGCRYPFGAGLAYVVFGKTGTDPVDLSSVEAGVGGFVLRGPTGRIPAPLGRRRRRCQWRRLRRPARRRCVRQPRYLRGLRQDGYGRCRVIGDRGGSRRIRHSCEDSVEQAGGSVAVPVTSTATGWPTWSSARPRPIRAIAIRHTPTSCSARRRRSRSGCRTWRRGTAASSSRTASAIPASTSPARATSTGTALAT